jgi:hypothetical protein
MSLEQTFIMIKPDGSRAASSGRSSSALSRRWDPFWSKRHIFLLGAVHQRRCRACLLLAFRSRGNSVAQEARLQAHCLLGQSYVGNSRLAAAQGYYLRALKLKNVHRELAEEHYVDLKSKPFYRGWWSTSSGASSKECRRH